ncbi:MAG TPA: TonB-dependent siderophore receptor [Allosphingosinicella sp.]|nr:TonB-dependent siderophore receptor [Allosphingosinicella sp.]
MTDRGAARTPMFLALGCVAALAAPARAGDVPAADEQEIVVTGERQGETGYRVGSISSAMRTETPLIDTPQSVSVVTARQIEDQAANSIGDAVRYTPGVFSAQGEGNRETLVFRGMTTTGDFFVDGVRDDVQTYRDLYNIERLEIFRGPNAMTFGRGGTGGIINRVTKAAGWQSVRELRLEAGMYDHYRGSADLGGPVSDTIALRATGVYQNSGSYRDGVGYERWGINPTASLRIGPDTPIQLGYEHFRDDRVADRGVPAQFRPAGFAGPVAPLATRRGEFFGDPGHSPTFTDTDAANLYVSHDFGGSVAVRNRTRYAHYDKFYQNIFPGLVNAATMTNPPGLPAGTYAPGTIVQIQAYNNAMTRENLINQTDLNARFATGGIAHTLLVGAEFGRQDTDNVRNEGFFPVPGNTGGVQTIFAAVAEPRIDRPDVLWRPLATSGDNKGRLDIAAFYVQDQIELSPQFEIVLGVRFEHLVTRVTDRRTIGFPAGQQRDFRVVDDLWSPRAGLIFKPAANASLYASFSRAYLPRGGDQLTSLNLANQSLDPERFTNYEIGAKWDLNPAFNVTAAVYQLDRENVIVLIDPNNPGAGTELGGGQRSRGFEVSVAGSLTDRLSMVGAYTYQQAEFRRAISASVPEGAEIPNAPRHSASLWGRYEVTPKLGIALGASYQGRRFAAQDNLVRLPGYARLDFAAYCRIDEHFDVQLNLENLLDKHYFVYANGNTNITPGSPTSARLALNVRF